MTKEDYEIEALRYFVYDSDIPAEEQYKTLCNAKGAELYLEGLDLQGEFENFDTKTLRNLVSYLATEFERMYNLGMTRGLENLIVKDHIEIKP